jgi:hypothetical protein
MYYPYFRGKQNELITIRDNADLLAKSNFVPIIEPVKEALDGLKRALGAVVAARGKAVIIVNPQHGELSSDGETLTHLLNVEFKEYSEISAGILLRGNTKIDDIVSSCKAHSNRSVTLIHAGFLEGKILADILRDATISPKSSGQFQHVFFEAECGKLYQKHFPRSKLPRVLIRDGFQRRKNREHPELEKFSDLHATYEDEGMNGFGDFLISGNDYTESGGPAYAIAIHITFIDSEKDDEMFVHHFVSDRQDTPKDPAGKFAESLEKMIRKLNEVNSKIFESKAIEEFRELYRLKHFPGLGYLKKLSMQHHIETLADYFEKPRV